MTNYGMSDDLYKMVVHYETRPCSFHGLSSDPEFKREVKPKWDAAIHISKFIFQSIQDGRERISSHDIMLIIYAYDASFHIVHPAVVRLRDEACAAFEKKFGYRCWEFDDDDEA